MCLYFGLAGSGGEEDVRHARICSAGSDCSAVALYLNHGISTKGCIVVLKSWKEIGVSHLNRGPFTYSVTAASSLLSMRAFAETWPEE